jgi:hypothetical protein
MSWVMTMLEACWVLFTGLFTVYVAIVVICIVLMASISIINWIYRKIRGH